jgi:hypothetical protein
MITDRAFGICMGDDPAAQSTFCVSLQVHRPAFERAKALDTLSIVSVLRAALVAICATALTAACAAGQQAATADEKPTLDGTQGSVGQIHLVAVALHTPTGASSYPAGADVPLSVYIANSGTGPDQLTNITSTAFPGGWNVVSTSSLPSASGSPSATPLPQPSGSASSAAAPSTGPTQSIGAGSSLGFGFTDLTPEGSASPKTLLLMGLASSDAPLTPGMSVKVTFTFAKAGQATLTVPVQLSKEPYDATLPASPTAEG